MINDGDALGACNNAAPWPVHLPDGSMMTSVICIEEGERTVTRSFLGEGNTECTEHSSSPAYIYASCMNHDAWPRQESSRKERNAVLANGFVGVATGCTRSSCMRACSPAVMHEADLLTRCSWGNAALQRSSTASYPAFGVAIELLAQQFT